MRPRKIIIPTDNDNEAKALQGTYANRSHYNRTFEDNVEVVTPEGRLIGRLFPGVLSDKALKRAYDSIKSIKTPITKRARVVGKNSMMQRINNDGIVCEEKEIPKAVRDLCGYSDTIGYLGPSLRFPHGRLSSYTKTHPNARPSLTPALRQIDRVFYEEYPAAHAWQAEAFPANGVYNWYDQMGDQTAFSSAYGNNMVRSANHPDARNLGGSLSALFTMGDYEGGGLVIVRFGVLFNLQPRDLLLFHGDDIHGVLPFKGERHSGVFFSAAQWTDFWEEVELPEPDPDQPPDPEPARTQEANAAPVEAPSEIVTKIFAKGASSTSLEDLTKFFGEVVDVFDHDRVIFCFINGASREWVRINKRDPDVMRAKFTPLYERGYVPFVAWHWWDDGGGNDMCESYFFPPFNNDESIDRAYSWPTNEIHALV